jgi:hypothetical protein
MLPVQLAESHLLIVVLVVAVAGLMRRRDFTREFADVSDRFYAMWQSPERVRC